MFGEINEVVQAEPPDGQNPEILGLLASIGIKKGQPFKPDARMKKILEEAAKMVGKGSQYAIAYLDAHGNALDSGKTYRVHLPPNVPAKDFWSFTLYDNQTRSMLQTDQQFPGIDNNKEGLQQNADGSYDIYFGPKAPAGKESNWLQTVPGKGWNMLFRLYGPLQPWFDKTWRPGDPELVK